MSPIEIPTSRFSKTPKAFSAMTDCRQPPVNRKKLEQLFSLYHKRRWVHPDPLEFLYPCHDEKNREIVGLIASALAYGRVAQILKSVSTVLAKMGSLPFDFVTSATDADLQKAFYGFRHRFTSADDLVDLLRGMRHVIRHFGSLQGCFMEAHSQRHSTVFEALCFLVSELSKANEGRPNSLLPLPEKGSACKRLHLFLRWMVRNDAVDPGGWDGVNSRRLIIPLDTHMHRICAKLGMTGRKQADFKTAMEITRFFRILSPEDPVKYDFVLTRIGIRKDCDPGDLF